MVTYTFYPGGVIKSSEVNQNFTDVETEVVTAQDQRTLILSGCDLTEQGSPGLTADVASGRYIIAGVPYSLSSTTATFTNADGSNPRWDLVSVNSSGTITVTDGTAAASPSLPSIPANECPLAAVYRATSDNTINTNEIVKFYGDGYKEEEHLVMKTSWNRAQARIVLPAGYTQLRLMIQEWGAASIGEVAIEINDKTSGYSYTSYTESSIVTNTSQAELKIYDDSSSTQNIEVGGQLLLTAQSDSTILASWTGSNRAALNSTGDEMLLHGVVASAGTTITSLEFTQGGTGSTSGTVYIYGIK